MHLIRSRITDLGLRSSSPRVNSILIWPISIHYNIYIKYVYFAWNPPLRVIVDHVLVAANSLDNHHRSYRLSNTPSMCMSLATASIEDTSRGVYQWMPSEWIWVFGVSRCVFVMSFMSSLLCRQCYCQGARKRSRLRKQTLDWSNTIYFPECSSGKVAERSKAPV